MDVDVEFLRPIIEETLELVDVVVPDHRGRRHAFRLRGLEQRYDMLRFELVSGTHYEELLLAIGLPTAKLKDAFKESEGPAAFAGALLSIVSKTVEARLAVPAHLEAMERDTTPRKRDRWNVRRTFPDAGVMYLEARPSIAGEVVGGKAWIHTRWVAEQLRDVAGRWDRKDAEELARRLSEGEDTDLFEVVPEQES